MKLGPPPQIPYPVSKFPPSGIAGIVPASFFCRVLYAKTDDMNPGRKRRTLPHCHNVYHIHLVSRGHGYFQMGPELMEAGEGALFLSAPGLPHNFGRVEGEDPVFSEVTFEFRNLNGQVMDRPFHEMAGLVLNRTFPAAIHALLDPDEARRIKEHLTRLSDTLHFGRLDDIESRLNLELAALLLSLYDILTGREKVPERSELERIRLYILANLTETVSLETLSARFGLSPNYLSRKFKRQYGRTPLAYQIDERVAVAEKLLLSTHLTVQEVSQRVGFSDIYYFSRLFKKKIGKPPSAFRYH